MKPSSDVNLEIKSDVRAAMKNLGFSDYFTNIYVALLELGELSAQSLSDVTKVPYSRIYEVLNDMIKKKIITKIDGRPSTFIGNDPHDVFNSLKKTQTTMFEENADNSLPYLRELYGTKQRVKHEEFTIYEGKKACFDHIRNVIMATEQKLYVILGNIEETFKEIELTLKFLHDKGVEVNVVLEERYRNHKMLKKTRKHGTIRFIERVHQGMCIADEKHALQILKGYFDIIHPKNSDYLAFSSSAEGFVRYLSQMFTFIWNSASE